MSITATPPVAEELEPFDVCGPLPAGTTVLEASAGTGKTFTIAALTARYLAEGEVELSDLMLVTFGRNASLELRLRVRERLVSTEAALRAAVSGAVVPSLDEVGALLCSGAPAELEVRRTRVARALAEFDAATIATTHEFCLQMLDGLGVLGDREPEAVFVEHLGDLVREVTNDVYLRRYAPRGRAPFDSFEDALGVAQKAVGATHTRLVPPAGDPDEATDAVERVSFVAEVRAEVERRKLAGRLFTYDDMLTRLRDALADPVWGEAAADRLRSRYRVVMVDEFQDTDPVQWDILDRAFSGHATLVLIGDPKQAIYAFRGADVFSYLDARAEAGTVRTLATNWRSDATLVEALGTLTGGAALGDPRIVVRPVAARHHERRLRSPGGAPPAPLRLRVHAHEADAEEPPLVGDVRPRLLRDLVADITATLESRVELHLDDKGWRPVQPADIAVLVRTNERGEEVREALVAAGVPAVMLGAGSVFTSPLAQEWLTLLEALEQPRQQLARRAALTPFVGWTFTQLAEATEDELTDLAQRVRRWSRVLAGRGVAALMETLTSDTRLPERLLGSVGGQRRLTDLRHLAEALHAAMVAGTLGVGALRAWLQDRITEARVRPAGDGSRRLDTDAEAVTVVTVHRSKGLEYPLVYLPDAWDRHVNTRDEGRTLSLHADGAPVLDVGGRVGTGRAERFRAALDEDAGESLRLLYVALTRAQCQVVAWWAPSHNTPASALQRFLYRGRTEGEVPAPAYPLSGDPCSLLGLGAGVALEPLLPRPAAAWQAPRAGLPTLGVRRFDRPLDLRWRRTSYSALTAAVHGLELSSPSVGSEAEPLHEDDESAPPVGSATAEPVPEGPLATPSPMGELPSGVDFGTAVHSIFELVDPTAPDLAVELRRATGVALGRSGAHELSVETLAAALLPSFLTPLGPLAGGRRLADIAPRDRLPELAFEMPLSGGDQARGEATLGRLAPLLRRHLAAEDPLRRYADLLEHPVLAEQPLRGYLNGSIDAVLRVRDAARVPRYLVVDYKTNWLGSFDGRPLTVGDYTPPRLAEAMMAAHYPLQALLYGVAVHRFLRWRQPGYDPATHLGGVLYLFVRGMAGADTPQIDGVPCGVFSWRPAAALISELSDLLDGRDPEEHR